MDWIEGAENLQFRWFDRGALISVFKTARFIAELLARAKRAQSGAPWVRKFGKLSIWENLVMT